MSRRTRKLGQAGHLQVTAGAVISDMAAHPTPEVAALLRAIVPDDARLRGEPDAAPTSQD